MFFRKITSCQLKLTHPSALCKAGLVWLSIVFVAFTVVGCSIPNSDTAEPEADPAEIEEIMSTEPEKLEAIVTVEMGSTLAIRKSPGTKDKSGGDVLDRVPEGRVFKIIGKHENSLLKDEYTLWEVKDTVTGISGWSAAEFLKEK